MAIVTTSKFQLNVDGVVQIFRPGAVLEGAAATWAVENGYGEERGQDVPPASQRRKPGRPAKGAPENADAAGAPENADAATEPTTKPLRSAKGQES